MIDVLQSTCFLTTLSMAAHQLRPIENEHRGGSTWKVLLKWVSQGKAPMARTNRKTALQGQISMAEWVPLQHRIPPTRRRVLLPPKKRLLHRKPVRSLKRSRQK